MLLGSAKADVESVLGKPAIAPVLLGLPGEKAHAYSAGPFDILVSYIGGLARAMAVKRKGGPQVPLTPPELGAAFSLNAPAALWEVKPAEPPVKPAAKAGTRPRASKIEPAPTTYFSHAERDPKIKEKVGLEIFGWMPGDRPYAFFFLPSLPGHPPVLASEWAVRGKLG